MRIAEVQNIPDIPKYLELPPLEWTSIATFMGGKNLAAALSTVDFQTLRDCPTHLMKVGVADAHPAHFRDVLGLGGGQTNLSDVVLYNRHLHHA